MKGTCLSEPARRADAAEDVCLGVCVVSLQAGSRGKRVGSLWVWLWVWVRVPLQGWAHVSVSSVCVWEDGCRDLGSGTAVPDPRRAFCVGLSF